MCTKIRRNFGMPRPEGYRKALRLMSLAEKFSLPLFTFVDTPGAYPGIGAEERGQSEAIGRNLYEMAGLRTPIVVTVIGEGGSGAAQAVAVVHAAVRGALAAAGLRGSRAAIALSGGRDSIALLDAAAAVAPS